MSLNISNCFNNIYAHNNLNNTNDHNISTSSNISASSNSSASSNGSDCVNNSNSFNSSENPIIAEVDELVLYALEHQEEVTAELLGTIETTLEHAEELSRKEDYILHFPAIYLLACFQEHKAYPQFVQFAALTTRQASGLFRESIAEDFKNLLASVCDGNLQPIKGIIENTSLDEFIRSEALQSLLVLLKEGIIPRTTLVTYFQELLSSKLEADNSFVWSTLPQCCSMLHPEGLLEFVEHALAEGKLSELTADLDHLHKQLVRPLADVLLNLQQDAEFGFIQKMHVIDVLSNLD